MKLNKKIKTHIVDMAIRDKYKAKFDALMQAMRDKAYSGLYDEYHNEDFELLPERSRKYVGKTTYVDVPTIRVGNYLRHGVERGYGLDVALQTRNTIEYIELGQPVYGTEHKFYNASDLFRDEYHDLVTFLKEASKARETLVNAMTHYRSCKKMFAELPWTEEYYPEHEKTPTVNLVPVSTIAAANGLMGVK